ncbi:unnamed protein product [Cylicocyclus nassatus]|uniref:Uncharacterized protein n=1 Tax=Cylicocyclus nassatus TaxID=53992 RepID=A0AA36H106_CYLNA|nr:unnamed protein product [Cylicocyclus nassatus]
MIESQLMLEDLLYDLLPVLGFVLFGSSILILVVMRKSTGAFRFTVWFAVNDLLVGLATIYAGFYGVVLTIYGKSGEMVTPSRCLLPAIHVPAWLFFDVFHLLLLLMFCFDRLMLMFVPVAYSRVSAVYLNWAIFFILFVASGAFVSPAFALSIESLRNESIVIPSICRLADVTGENYYLMHTLAMQWVPLAGMACVMLSLLMYGIRRTRQKWSYNWSEESENSKQLYVAIFLRCLLMVFSVHVPLLFLYRTPSMNQLDDIKDFLVRIPYYTFVGALQPLWYVLAMPEFSNNIRLLFNQYGQNTERKWQSADDPPQSVDNMDPHGDVNPWGSWYSSAGNVTGEAGLPLGNERSISFYYEGQ